MPGGTFKPGEKVPTTGIYTATHQQHRLPHEVFAVEGDEFPSCRKCGNEIHFVLVQAASHIDLDRDFTKGNSGSRKITRAAHKKGEE
jgi:hypothetical protein